MGSGSLRWIVCDPFVLCGVFSVVINRKPYREIDELVNLLRSRGLIFSQEEELELKQYLRTIGYYRLSGYFWYFYTPPVANTEHIFKPNTQWKEVRNLYDSDEQLRIIFFTNLLRLEITLKAILCEAMGQATQDSEWIYNLHYFNSKNLSNFSSKIYKTLDTNKSVSFVDSEQYPYFPKHEVWKLFMLYSFGESIILLNSLKKNYIEDVSACFNLEYQYFLSILQGLKHVRNICAHSSRLWNIDHNKLPAIQPFLLKNQSLSKQDIDSKSLVNAIMSLYLILKRTDAIYADAFLHDIDTWIKVFVPIEDLNNPYVRSLGLKTEWKKYVQTMQSF
jgi:abortive infection bacteriophage resistance protein